MDARDVTGRTSAGGRIGAALGGLAAVAALTVGVLALDSATPAAAAGLERFESCAALQSWTDDLQDPVVLEELDAAAAAESVGGDGRASSGEGSAAGSGGPAAAPAAASDDVASDAGAAPPSTVAAEQAADEAESATASDGDSGDTGGTNTVVEGVDEIDVIDRIGEDRLLVSRNGVLALVELSTLTLVAELPGVPYDARISVVDGLVFAAGSAADGTGTEVLRARIDGDAVVEEGRWRTPGYLLDARRTGDRLHVVVVDQPYGPGVVPFDGGPVPCDEVWRPVEPATTPAATLVATLPGSGALAPTAAAEVTGAGGNLLVTADAAYVVTETYSAEGEVSSGIHRFDLATLEPTGSGAIPGSVAGPFALSEFEGHLRVATSRSGGAVVGRPMPVEGDGGIGGPDITIEPLPAVDPAPAVEPAQDEPTTTTVVEEPTSTTAPEPTTTVVEATTTTVAETTTTFTDTTTTAAAPADESALAEVFVLDLEGDLDVVGSTGRFGRDFETIHGVRFVGAVGYVVTFLQTDPFWVLDLSDPAAPAVVGELQIPGFSGYLHPVGDDRVVGFGPDGQGRVAARLFDVSDPAAPAVVDEVTLGDDSPVAYDHHAFVGLGEARFAVPVTDYPEYVGGDCFVIDDSAGVRDPGMDPSLTPDSEVGGDLAPPADTDPASSTSSSGAGTTGSAPGIAVGEPVPTCAPPEPVGGRTGAVVLEVVGGRLTVADEATIERPDVYAERVVQAPDGTWILLSYDRLAATAGGQELVLPSA